MSVFLTILIIAVVLALILTGMAAAEDGYMGVAEFFAIWAIASAVFTGLGSLVCWGLDAFDEDVTVSQSASSRSGMGGDGYVEKVVAKPRAEEVETPRESTVQRFDFGLQEIETGSFGGEKQ